MNRQRNRENAGIPFESSSHVTKENFSHKLQETCGAVRNLEEELHLVKDRMEKMEAFYMVQLSGAGLTEMDHFYKDKLQKERAALKESQEELKSFKDRVAGDITLSMKTADLENMNSPVNTTRLKEMDEGLRLQWTKVKKFLRSTRISPDSVEAQIQQRFDAAATYIEEKKRMILMLFDLGQLNLGPMSQKVIQYRQLSVQNLQMAIYHSRKESSFQQPFSEQRVESSQNVEDFLSQCFWVGCLMALNDPPLTLSWGNLASTTRAPHDQRPDHFNSREGGYC